MSQQPVPTAASAPGKAGTKPRPDLPAGLLSLAVPGLGQFVQGLRRSDAARLGKGVFFLLTIWGMFFTGQAMGAWQNVYLPQYQQAQEAEAKLQLFGWTLPDLLGNLYLRLPYVGQFWVGLPAWPALWNYAFPDTEVFGSSQRSPGALKARDRVELDKFDKIDRPAKERERRRELLREAEAEMNKVQFAHGMGKNWDIALIYTIIAGVLNILVIYDAAAGPMYPRRTTAPAPKTEGNNP